MPSPIGHLLGGAAVYLGGTRPESRSRLVLSTTLLGSIVPDFDFLPGIAIGQMGAFHHGISHSAPFAIFFAAVVFLILQRIDKAEALRAAVLAFIAYLTHVVLDFVGVSEGTRGVPILWPLSGEKLGYSLNLFGHFRWGDIRDGLGSIIRWDNVMPLVREVLVVGTIILLIIWRERRANRNRHHPNRALL
jgi:hypothetical protein